MSKLSIVDLENKKTKENVAQTYIHTIVSIDRLSKDYEELAYDLIGQCVDEKISQQELNKQLNQLNEIKKLKEQAEKISIEHSENKEEEKTLNNKTKQKIYYYYKTGDYKQEQLAEIYNTTQPTISRVCKKIEKENKKGV